MLGKTISHYKIIEKLGEGGMGVVYKAEDTKLKREVALKFLPLQAMAGEEEKARFEHEAQAAAALDHPNICTVYEINEADGQVFIAMAYVEGQSLQDLVTHGPMPLQDVLGYSTQISEGLQAAHEKGVVHRDIKPANILITKKGQVRITDFGLAKLAGRTQLTQKGTSMGTVAYMSPEQTQGIEVDHRTDIWAFGAVMYEMITGQHPFIGDYQQAVMYSIMNEDPEPPTALRTGVPMELERIVNKALAKNPDERYQHIDEMLADLKVLSKRSESRVVEAKQSSAAQGYRKTVFVLGAALLAALVVTALLWRQRTETDDFKSGRRRKPIHATMRQVTFSAHLEEYPAFSRDGKRLAYSQERDGYKHLFVKNLETDEVTRLTQGERDNVQPAWSADDKSILFVRASDTGGKLRVHDIFQSNSLGDIWSFELESGKTVKLIEEAFNPSVSPDGKWIAFDASWARTRRIWKADHLGRNPQQLSSDPSEQIEHIIPRWSPDGSKIVFQNIEKEKTDIKMVDVNTKIVSAVTSDPFKDVNPVWSPSGKDIYFSSYRSGGLNIWRVPISGKDNTVGELQQVTAGAGQDVQIAFSPDGQQLAFSVLNLNADIWKLPLSPQTGRPTGPAEPLIASTREDNRGAWSPDGTRVAFNSDRTGDMNIWISSLTDGTTLQLTKGPGGDYQPNWAPDGKQLVFFSSRSGNTDIWVVGVDTRELRQLTESPSLEMNPFFSPNGQWIAYQSDNQGRKEVWLMRADGTHQRRLTNIGVNDHYMLWSLNSKSIIFRVRNVRDNAELAQVFLDGADVRPFARVDGRGYHISFSPDHSLLLDNNHRAVWLTDLASGLHFKIFEFDDPDIRIDYTVWSPDGNWVLFDRLKPQGGDIWVMENFE